MLEPPVLHWAGTKQSSPPCSCCCAPRGCGRCAPESPNTYVSLREYDLVVDLRAERLLGLLRTSRVRVVQLHKRYGYFEHVREFNWRHVGMVKVQLDQDLELSPTNFLNLVGRFVDLPDWVGEAGVEGEGDLLNEIAEILIVDSSHVADPLMRVAVSLLAHRKGQRAVYVGEYYLLSLRVLLLLLHHRPQLISNISKDAPSLYYHSRSLIVLKLLELHVADGGLEVLLEG